ncbi:hypothetical protein [Haliscomenobacter hydrossis]|uniref:Uncharacterized protein n=1 Tax=Haliscomenobacter hydrossis (strain ATCC 27775 / DSM 1100 / LMG 10767 / O) TaxID=760192 RepID=F4L325_HALH1|nr:hypothetical protein [Haliscomenobacter hydrossis]AEE50684.1 hypothetical protein Halhy_2818 [Haliscomenobacter hydrossis DSM 1100]
MNKKFFFKEREKISRAYQWNELLELELNENTQIWTKEFCPEGKSVENCKKHWQTLKEYTEKQENESNYEKSSSNKKGSGNGDRFTLIAILIFSCVLLPYISSGE